MFLISFNVLSKLVGRAVNFPVDELEFEGYKPHRSAPTAHLLNFFERKIFNSVVGVFFPLPEIANDTQSSNLRSLCLV